MSGGGLGPTTLAAAQAPAPAQPAGQSFLQGVGQWASNVTHFNDVVADWNRAFNSDDNVFHDLVKFGLSAGQQAAPVAANLTYTVPGSALASIGQGAQDIAGTVGRAATAPYALSHPEWGRQLGMTDQQYQDMVKASIWDLNAPVSPGQILNADASSTNRTEHNPFFGLLGMINPDWNPLYTHLYGNVAGENINPYDQNQRAKYFTDDGAPAKWSSGITDAALSTAFDPTNLAGPGLRGFKAVALGERTVSDAAAKGLFRGPTITTNDFLAKLVDQGGGGYSDFANRMIQETSPARIMQDPFVRSGAVSDPRAFSLITARANDMQSFTDSMLVMSNADPALKADAVGRLLARSPEDTELPYLLDRLQNGSAEKIIANITGEDHIVSQGVLDKQAGLVQAYLKDENTAFGRAYQTALQKVVDENPTGIIRATPKSNRATALGLTGNRASNVYGEYPEPTVTTIQPSDSHPLMSVVDWFTQGRPSGIVSADAKDNAQEFLAMLQHGDKYTNGALRQSGEMQNWMDAFLAAQNPHDLMSVVRGYEERAAGLVAMRHGFTEDEAKTLYQNTLTRRRAAVQQAQDMGFISMMVDGNPVVAVTPNLIRQTASEIHVGLDLRQYDKALSQAHPEGLRAALDNAANFENPGKPTASSWVVDYVADPFNNLLKMNMLMRLGYTFRNVGEAYLSMAASGYLGSVAMTAVSNSPKLAADWVANRALGVTQHVDRVGLRLGARESYASLQGRTAEALAKQKMAEENLNLDTMLLRGYDMHTADLSPESLKQLAALRAETDQAITYHVTDTGLPEIKGDWLPTTENRATAAGKMDDLYQYHSVEDLGSQPGENAGNPVGRGQQVSALMERARQLLADGSAVDYRTPTGWAPMTAKTIDSYIERHTRDGVLKPISGDERMVLRSRAAGKKPDVVAVRSYGKTLDATDARTLPVGLDVNDRAALARYARSEGYGRVIVKDPEWGNTALVLRDTADYKGGMGAGPIIERNARDIAHEAEANTVIRALPVRTRGAVAKANREANRGAMKLTAKPSVIPGYTANEIKAQFQNNIIDNIRQHAAELAQAKAERDFIETQFENRAAKVSQVYRDKRKVFTGPGEAFDRNDPQGRVMARLTSSESMQARLIGSGDVPGGTAVAQGVIGPEAPRYFEGWARMLNHYVRGEDGKVDPAWQMMLDGKTNDDLARWMLTDKQGRAWADAVGWHGEDQIAQKVAEMRSSFDMYLPKEIHPDILGGHVFTEHDLRQKFGERTDLPDIYARLIPGSPEQRSNLMGEALHARMAGRFFHFLGALPETVLARHPLFNAAFQREQARMVGELKARLNPGEKISIDDINKIKFASREHARQVVNSTLYTINRRTDAARQLRFVSPFYAAWENAIKRWSGFVIHNPDQIARMSSKATQVLNNLTIVDQNGDVIPLSTALGDWDTYKNAAVLLPWADKSRPQSQTQISLQSLDVALGGQPGPGLGPIGTFPLAEIVARNPDAEQMFSWAFPVGVPKDVVWDTFLSAWQRKLRSAITQDSTFTNTVAQVYQQKYLDWVKAGGTGQGPTAQDAIEDARKLYALRIFSNLASPVSLQFNSDVQYYVSALHTLEDKYRNDPKGIQKADGEFLQKYPEAFIVLPSLSQSTFGVNATLKSVDQAQRYSSLANSADALGDPNLFGFVANYGQTYSKGDYSQAAYSWEFNNGPEGTDKHFRNRMSVDDIARTAQVDKGYIQFRQVMDQTEAEMKSMGIDPASKYGAQLISKVRAAYSFDQQAKNPAWYEDYRNSDPAKYDKREQFFKQVMADPTFMKDHGSDPLFDYVKNFFVARDYIAGQLRDRKMAGGSSSLSASSNVDLATTYTQVQEAFKDQNIQFAAWLDRYFTNDPVSF